MKLLFAFVCICCTGVQNAAANVVACFGPQDPCQPEAQRRQGRGVGQGLSLHGTHPQRPRLRSGELWQVRTPLRTIPLLLTGRGSCTILFLIVIQIACQTSAGWPHEADLVFPPEGSLTPCPFRKDRGRFVGPSEVQARAPAAGAAAGPLHREVRAGGGGGADVGPAEGCPRRPNGLHAGAAVSGAKAPGRLPGLCPGHHRAQQPCPRAVCMPFF